MADAPVRRVAVLPTGREVTLPARWNGFPSHVEPVARPLCCGYLEIGFLYQFRRVESIQNTGREYVIRGAYR